MVPEVEYLSGIPVYNEEAVMEFGNEFPEGFSVETPPEVAVSND